MKPTQVFPGVYKIGGSLATRSLTPGFKVHGERLLEAGNAEYREWNPFQSKLAAAIACGLHALPIKEGSRVLYLGAAQGATASFVSDIVGEKGVVYCVEIAPRAASDLIKVCEKRENMIPILADARKPGDYAGEIEDGEVDVVFEDVADPQQAEILKSNACFLKKGAVAMLAVKARSVSSVEEPRKVFEKVKRELEDVFELVQEIDISPFEKDHEMLLLRKRT
jgi:fibrillarin-like pre-rRNA processing protein